jgi:2-polyprenyl-3-methyl-5-hydroxy-6-metoxy-1,4-benzoquinol methylase
MAQPPQALNGFRSDEYTGAYTVMTSILRSYLNRHPRLKAAAKALLGARSTPSVSTNYVELDAGILQTVETELQGAWKHNSLPERQRKLVNSQLKSYLAGEPVIVFDTLVEALKRLPPAERTTLLEIGCSSGYYSEVLAARGIDARYHGCDYSTAFIDLARRCYPEVVFDVMDATQLGYADGQFDVVVSGSCLLHIPDYPTTIAETARVASHYAIFHRTPVLHKSATRHFTKDAYGVKTIEIHFNEKELVRLFAQNRLQVVDILTIDAGGRNGDAFAVKTYVCRKVPA